MKKITFIFPGQGAQYVGMGKWLITEHKVAKDTFQEASDLLGKDLIHLSMNGRLSEIGTLSNSLMMIYITSIAAYRVYMKEIGVKPQFLMGHSLGEYSALTCSGVIQFEDGIRIVNKRSQLAEKIANQGISGMTIIGQINSTKIMELCSELQKEGAQIYVCCINTDSQLAVSGELDDLKILEDRAKAMGGEISPLFGNAPFHCPLMNDVIEEFKSEIDKYTYRNARIPVIVNATGELFTGYEDIGSNLIKQITNPVNWKKMNEQLDKYGIDIVIEISPKNTLSKFVNQNTPFIETYYFDNKYHYKKLLEMLKMNGCMQSMYQV